MFGPKSEQHLQKQAKLKTEAKKMFSNVSYKHHGSNKVFPSDPPSNTRDGGQSLILFLNTSSNTTKKKGKENRYTTCLDNSWDMMKKQLEIKENFSKLATPLDYVNLIKNSCFNTI